MANPIPISAEEYNGEGGTGTAIPITEEEFLGKPVVQNQVAKPPEKSILSKVSDLNKEAGTGIIRNMIGLSDTLGSMAETAVGAGTGLIAYPAGLVGEAVHSFDKNETSESLKERGMKINEALTYTPESLRAQKALEQAFYLPTAAIGMMEDAADMVSESRGVPKDSAERRRGQIAGQAIGLAAQHGIMKPLKAEATQAIEGIGANKVSSVPEVKPIVKPSTEVVSDNIVAPTQTIQNRRNRQIIKDIEAKKTEQVDLNSMLKKQKEDNAAGNLIIADEPTTIQPDMKIFVDQKITELNGDAGKIRELYKTDSPVDVYAREQAQALDGIKYNGVQKGYGVMPDKQMYSADINGVQTTFVLEPGETLRSAIDRKIAQAKAYEQPPSVQKLNKEPIRLTEEEFKKIEDTNLFEVEELDALKKQPGFKQREQYNRIFPPELKYKPEDIAKAEKIYQQVDSLALSNKAKARDIETLRKEGWEDAEIAKMDKAEVARKASVLRGEVNPLNPSKEGLDKLTVAEQDIKAFREELGNKPLSELTDVEEARYTELLAKLEKELGLDEVIEPAYEKKNLYIEEPREVTMSPEEYAAHIDRRDLIKSKAKKVVPKVEEEVVTRRRTSSDKEVMSKEEIESILESEGMDSNIGYESEARAELNFNEKAVGSSKKTNRQVSEESLAIVIKTLDDIKNRRKVIHSEPEARNLLVDAYKVMPRTLNEAIKWDKLCEQVETIVADKIEHKRSAFSRKAIAEALAKKEITKQEAQYSNAIFNTLKQQPTMALKFDPTMETAEGTYAFARNLITIKNVNALAHEVGHFAMDNVLTREDRALYRKNFIENYYKDGKLDFSKIRLSTTNPRNAVINPAEVFACKFADYLHEKVLTPVEMTLFQKVKNWFSQLKTELMKRGGDTKFNDVEQLFEKVLDPNRRRFWSEDLSRPIVEPIMREAVNAKLSLDDLSLRSIADRISTLADVFRKAKMDDTGHKILAEIKGNDFGLATELKGQTLFSVDNTTVSQRLWRNLGPWIQSPMEFVKGTRNERHVYNTNLAEMFISHMYDQHKTTIDAIERGVRHSDGVAENVRQVIEGKIEGKPSEQVAAQQVREWLDGMKARYKLYLINDYKANLSKREYNILLDLISGTGIEEVKLRNPKVATDVIEEIATKYKEIDTWGIDNYIPNVEAGRFKILADGTTVDGKPYQKLIAIGLSEKDAIRKATKYLEENPQVSSLKIDTDYKMISDDKTTITRGQYYGMMNSLAKKMMESIDGIEKGVAREMARKTLQRKFKITPTDSYSPFLEKRQDILQGEENIFPVLRSYAHSLEKKMALDPVIDIIRRDIPKMDKYERAYILDYIEDVKGRYSKADKFVDDTFRTYRGYSRLISRTRTIEANLKLGYRPVAAAVNLASGQLHAWVKRGTPIYLEGVKFLHTPEGKQFIRDVEPFLGTSIVESGVELKAKTPIYHPLGLFQMPEPLNRQVSVAAAYRQGLKEGMSELAAKEFAIRANWAEQFTYNMANLPKIMRGSTGKLLTQFKPYLVKEVEFMSNLSAREWVRYAEMQLALGGPRGYMMMIRSLPILAGFAFWEDLEEWMNKNAPLASRGVAGAPGLIDPSLGMDISAASTFQFPTGPKDIMGPAISDLVGLKQKVFDPLIEQGAYAEDYKKTGDIAPIWRHWKRLIDFTFSDDNWVRDDKGNKLYEVQSTIPFIVQSLAGVENVDLNRIKAEQRILASRDERIGGTKTRLINESMQYVLNGKTIPDELKIELRKNGVTAESLINRVQQAKLTPRQRAILNTEIRRRRDVMEMFPSEGDYSEEDQSHTGQIPY